MSTRYAVGEWVTVLIDRAQVHDVGVEPGTGRLVEDLVLAITGANGVDYLRVPVDSPAVAIIHVAPREWPPMPGEVWEDCVGRLWFAHETTEGIDLRCAEVSGGLVDDDHFAREHGPVRRVFPPVEGERPPAREVSFASVVQPDTSLPGPEADGSPESSATAAAAPVEGAGTVAVPVRPPMAAAVLGTARGGPKRTRTTVARGDGER